MSREIDNLRTNFPHLNIDAMMVQSGKDLADEIDKDILDRLMKLPPIHKGKKHIDEGYIYAPYIPMMYTGYPIDDYLTKLQSDGRLYRDTTIILKKRNRKPNNRLVL